MEHPQPKELWGALCMAFGLGLISSAQTFAIAPQVNDDSFTTDLNQPISFYAWQLLINDNDPDEGDILNILWTGDAVNGTVERNTANGYITFTPAPGFSGIASFRYRAYDMNAESDDAIVSVNVLPNQTLVVGDDHLSTPRDTVLRIYAANLMANDGAQNGQILAIHQISDVVGGSVEELENIGQVHFTPTPGFSGTAGFSYTVIDQLANISAQPGRVSIEIASNANPIVRDDSFTTPHNTPLVIQASDLIENDTDPNANDTLVVNYYDDLIENGLSIEENTNPGSLVMDSDTQTITYTPHNGFSGTSTFIYGAKDSHDAMGWAQVSITVEENAKPVLRRDNLVLSASEVSYIHASEITANDSDINQGDQITVQYFDDLSLGAMTFNREHQTFIYTPPNTVDESSGHFVYAASDDAGAMEWAIVDFTLATEEAPLRDLAAISEILGETPNFSPPIYNPGNEEEEIVEDNILDNRPVLSAQTQGNNIDLTWTNPTAAEQYRILFWQNNESPTEVTVLEQSYSLVDFSLNHVPSNFWFVVEAYDNLGSSVFSQAIRVTE